ncbi:MAG: uracil-DNA glycosylase family protein [Acidiferrobacteraceae bacterium]
MHSNRKPGPLSSEEQLRRLLRDVRTCHACPDLPLGPNPVLRVASTAQLLVVGQVPGIHVHRTGIPWNDASGRRLRAWLRLVPEEFYQKAPQCSACNRVAVQGVVKRRYRPQGDHSGLSCCSRYCLSTDSGAPPTVRMQ